MKHNQEINNMSYPLFSGEEKAHDRENFYWNR